MCRSALSARSSSAHDLPGRFAPDAPLQTASVYVKIMLDTQNCILFCVFKISIWDFCAKSIFDVCWILPSLPSRGAWIEIPDIRCTAVSRVSLPSRGAWIEIRCADRRGRTQRSLPSRGAWIEIGRRLLACARGGVAPLAGSVDRNRPFLEIYSFVAVAPLAGSVDRNRAYCLIWNEWFRSLPSRGAWIEIIPAWTAADGWSRRSPCGERG